MTETRHGPRSDDRITKKGPFDDFRRLANHSQDAIYHYDIASRRFLFHNQKFQSFFRLESNVGVPATSARIIESIHPEDREHVLKSMKQSMVAGQAEGEAEYRILYPDGAIRWLHDRWIVIRNPEGNPTAIQGFIRDYTQRKLSELQFIESKKYALIGSYIAQGGRFIYVNPKFISITGYDEEELIGKDSLEIVHEDYRDHVRQSAIAMLRGVSMTPYEFCVLDKSRNVHWIMESVTSVIYRGKRAVLGYFMDISKLHQMKDNLSTLGLMVGTISHSLRGCLTGLNASLYLIETGFYRNMPAQIEEGLDVTKLMADRIRKLVLDILYYSKERELELEEVEVWRFVKDVVIHLENRIKAANIRFHTDCPPDSGCFKIDPEKIRAALINILENAMEACIDDTRNISHWIQFTTRVDDARVYFDISDNGPGMEKEQARKAFRLFSSTKGNRGTGIGLFVTRKVILEHVGTISVESQPDEGAIFRITLPRKPRAHD